MGTPRSTPSAEALRIAQSLFEDGGIPQEHFVGMGLDVALLDFAYAALGDELDYVMGMKSIEEWVLTDTTFREYRHGLVRKLLPDADLAAQVLPLTEFKYHNKTGVTRRSVVAKVAIVRRGGGFVVLVEDAGFRLEQPASVQALLELLNEAIPGAELEGYGFTEDSWAKPASLVIVIAIVDALEASLNRRRAIVRGNEAALERLKNARSSLHPE